MANNIYSDPEFARQVTPFIVDALQRHNIRIRDANLGVTKIDDGRYVYEYKATFYSTNEKQRLKSGSEASVEKLKTVSESSSISDYEQISSVTDIVEKDKSCKTNSTSCKSEDQVMMSVVVRTIEAGEPKNHFMQSSVDGSLTISEAVLSVVEKQMKGLTVNHWCPVRLLFGVSNNGQTTITKLSKYQFLNDSVNKFASDGEWFFILDTTPDQK